MNEQDLDLLPTAYDYPHLLALLIVVVLITGSTGIWSAKKRGEIRTTKDNLLSYIIFFAMMVLHVTFLYFLPGIVIVSLIKFLLLGYSFSYQTSFNVLIDPSLKIAVLICLSDNFADSLSVEKKVSLGVHYFQFLFLFFPAYYGTMAVSWLLARLIAAGGGFEQIYVQAANNLFDVPILHLNSTFNLIILLGLIIIGASISYWLRISRMVK